MTGNKNISIVQILLMGVVLSGLYLFGCADQITAPADAIITVTPEKAAINGISADTAVNFKALVQYADGTPMPYAKLNISSAFANPNGMGLFQFYYYPDGTQRVGGNVTVNSPFEAQTDEFGTYDFSVVIPATSNFTEATIYVTSGAVVGTATLASTHTI